MSNQKELLRAEAEAKLGVERGTPVRSVDMLRHEIEVHQIELEMQNETLRQTQLALEESRDRYADLYDFAPVGYLTLNADGLIAEANFTSTDLLGLARKELLGGRFSKFVVDEDRERWYRFFLGISRNLSIHRCELTFKRADGTFFSTQLECVQKVTANGELVTRIVLIDITARRKSDMALRESEAKLRGLYDVSPLGIALTDMQGRYIEFNHTFADICGYPADELRELDYWTLTPKEYEVPELRQLDNLQRTGRYGPYEKEYIRKDGQRVPVRLHGALIMPQEGQQYIWSMVEDITVQRQEHEHLDAINRELRESENKLSAIYEGALDGIALMDLQSMRFYSGNPALCNMLGYRSEEFTGMKVADIHRPADLAWIMEDIQKRMRGEIDLNVNIPVLRRDGSVLYVDIKSTAVTIGGKAYMLGVFRDASHRRKVEKELREYQQSLRDLAAQGAALRESELKHVAREVHDELGQILTALRMDISLLRIQFGAHDAELMPKVMDMLILVDKAIQCARDVTTNLHPPALDMGLVSAINWLAGEFTRRTAIPCKVQIQEEPGSLEDAAILTLFRIVQESLTNITRYAKAAAVEINLDKCDQFIIVSIKDDGIGFDCQIMPVMKTYGLMGMKERALAAGGKVEVSSIPGRGTTVLVEIPLIQLNSGRRVND